MLTGRAGRLIASILICQAAGAVGSIFTISAVSTWYLSIQKPSFTPPNWLFGPVWTALYLLMGVSLYLLWSKGLQNTGVRTALVVFGSQLALNILWSYLFFGLHLLFLGLVEIVILWVAIALTILTSYRVSRNAGILLIPYIGWVSIAALLNYYVWILNP